MRGIENKKYYIAKIDEKKKIYIYISLINMMKQVVKSKDVDEMKIYERHFYRYICDLIECCNSK